MCVVVTVVNMVSKHVVNFLSADRSLNQTMLQTLADMIETCGPSYSSVVSQAQFGIFRGLSKLCFDQCRLLATDLKTRNLRWSFD